MSATETDITIDELRVNSRVPVFKFCSLDKSCHAILDNFVKEELLKKLHKDISKKCKMTKRIKDGYYVYELTLNILRD